MVQHKDGGTWTHDTVMRSGDHNYNDRSYMIHITKTGQIVTKKQETHKINTHKSRTIPLRYIKQKHCRHARKHTKTL